MSTQNPQVDDLFAAHQMGKTTQTKTLPEPENPSECCPKDVDENTPQNESSEKLETIMLRESSKIATIRSANVFDREITDDEKAIVAARVAFNQKMMALYERREKSRKIEEIRNICADLDEEEAQYALDEYGGSEDRAIAALTGAGGDHLIRRFKAHVKAHKPKNEADASAEVDAEPKAAANRPAGNPTTGVVTHKDMKKAKGAAGCFVGSFRGKLYKPANRPAAASSKQSRAKVKAEAEKEAENEAENEAEDEAENKAEDEVENKAEDEAENKAEDEAQQEAAEQEAVPAGKEEENHAPQEETAQEVEAAAKGKPLRDAAAEVGETSKAEATEPEQASKAAKRERGAQESTAVATEPAVETAVPEEATTAAASTKTAKSAVKQPAERKKGGLFDTHFAKQIQGSKQAEAPVAEAVKPANIKMDALVGRRFSVTWPTDQRLYYGTVAKVNKRKRTLYLVYDPENPDEPDVYEEDKDCPLSGEDSFLEDGYQILGEPRIPGVLMSGDPVPAAPASADVPGSEAGAEVEEKAEDEEEDETPSAPQAAPTSAKGKAKQSTKQKSSNAYIERAEEAASPGAGPKPATAKKAKAKAEAAEPRSSSKKRSLEDGSTKKDAAALAKKGKGKQTSLNFHTAADTPMASPAKPSKEPKRAPLEEPEGAGTLKGGTPAATPTARGSKRALEHRADASPAASAQGEPGQDEAEEGAVEEAEAARKPKRARGKPAAEAEAEAEAEEDTLMKDAKADEEGADAKPSAADSEDTRDGPGTATEGGAAVQSADQTMEAGPSSSEPKARGPCGRAKPNSGRLGRVKRCSVKSCELVSIGTVSLRDGWHNRGYIFPDGYEIRTNFRASVDIDQLCVHVCSIFSKGKFHPAPTFRVLAMDRPDEPLDGKSATACWKAILDRINAEINERRRNGENLPAPPRTAIAGPEYFGLNHPNVVEQLEAQDPEHKCSVYWEGKDVRSDMMSGVAAVAPPRAQRAPAASRSKSSRAGRGRNRFDSDNEDEEEEAEEEGEAVSNKWSSINRGERYKNRHGEMAEQEENPLPGFIDPITLEEVVKPAISPHGQVMGYATWIEVLKEANKCPFTKKPLNRNQLTVLNVRNIERFRDQIVGL
ncbi:hypothetical protein CYMTET_8016 [Cymbomonas tetramitiformis]|uniref:U-box domain-containing protein n=1 Tax=Cymbomonas tetramitiformis TaxID=36881 RepID=A0AAE0LGA2_9CHLO|nr:hypothetical protein CYMTET_8016 [Cymbomonas tetramitiformis]